MTLLRRWAAAAPVPVYAVAGADGLTVVEDLALHPGVVVRDSPRHAALLVVRGTLREADRPYLDRLHDQMPHPRATLWWEDGPSPAETLAETWTALLHGRRDSEPDRLPNEPPNPWRGKGDFGQGGEGMMGGVPYGRPMAMTGDDLRDGLALDAYTTEVGPFLPGLPPGLLLTVTLQGDVVQTAEMLRPPYPQAGDTPRRRLARVVRLLGLPALAERLLRGAVPESRLRRAGVFAAHPPIAAALHDLSRDRWPEPHDALEHLPGLEWHEAILSLAVHPPAPEDPS